MSEIEPFKGTMMAVIIGASIFLGIFTHERFTASDAEVSDKLRALHKGSGPVRVHRMIERETVSRRDDLPRRKKPDSPKRGTT